MARPDHSASDAPLLRVLLQSRAKFRAFLIQQVGSAEAADDILQQAYARVAARGERLKKQDSVVSWFYRILRRLAIDYYRSRAAAGRREASLVRQYHSAGEHDAAAQRAQERLCGCFEALLPALKPDYAQILRRIDLNHEPLEEVAHALRVTPNNLSVRLHRARAALRKSLQKACGSCASHGCLDCSCTHPPQV